MNRLFLHGCPVLLPEGIVEGVGILCAGGAIERILPAGAAPQEAQHQRLPAECLLTAGYIDIQVNGGGGVMFNDGPTIESARHIAAAHRRLGTTGIMPTLITSTRETMREAARAAPAFRREDGLLGIHFEGPFISKARPGVHRPDYIRQADESDLALLEDLAANGMQGRVLLTIAPEDVPAGMQARLTASGMILSAGHSAAPAEALDSGMVTLATHLFNAMEPMTARNPGLAGAVLAGDLHAGLIVDGYHVHPAMLRLAAAALGMDRIVLVSDAMAVAGTEASGFDLQGQRILRRDGILVTEGGTLAGADLCMAQAVRNAVALMGASQEQAIRMATANPADALRLADSHGRIAPGLRADFCLLSPDLHVLGTWLGGVWAPAP